MKRDEIMLYWSGELDEGTSRKVERMLQEDPEARACYEEICEFWDALDGLPQHEPTRPCAEEAIARIATGKPLRRFPLWSAVGVAAAVVLLAGITYQVLTPSRNETPLGLTHAGQKAVPASPVSERRSLLSSGSQFSEWNRATSARERIRHLRSQFNTVRASSL
ncbi:MAG: hypothetical protein AAF591_20315 [Verrucomicrobiota bacterium]